ncbi:TonB-dependent receptor [Thiomicrorhabdus heinhorstiae]|uniref:DUF560 domain-containing protein n=1 Tax=Thiomicrorhabdus heinhorstiae TaxID=2748010 RepID=A0ABS0BT97_9GAMM|nr:hypothetical protein [Thiomicrorhabdus heinhorstiae]MBF6057072.1 hypothetical protein [Thiomicrorhabdus heinhorstiae]
MNAGLQSIDLSEFSINGNRLVSESGILPVIGLQIDTDLDSRWLLSAYANYSRGDLDYDGHLQSGSPYRSSTATEISTYGVSLKSPLGGKVLNAEHSLLLGFEYERWRRQIAGSHSVSELTEKYDSPSIFVGLNSEWPSFESSLIAAYRYNSTMDLDLSDQAYGSMELPGSLVIRLHLEKPLLKRLSANLSVQYAQTTRSSSYPLYASSDSSLIGNIIQPEHSKSSIAFYLSYLID